MQTWLDKINDQLAAWVGIIVSLSFILALRFRIWCVIRSVANWFSVQLTVANNLSQMIRQINRIEKALFNGGADGLVQNMDMIKAQCRNTFECSPAPMFICDNRGGNVSVNAAYRTLVQVWRDDEIGGTQWQSVIYGLLKPSYIDGFTHASANNEDFIGDVDFCNPMTNQHRGRWKIHAPASNRTEGGSIYVGRFVAALDSEAASIANHHQWHVTLPKN